MALIAVPAKSRRRAASGATVETTLEDIASSIPGELLRLLAHRAPEASLCPSEVARSLAEKGGDWRKLMIPIRSALKALVVANQIIVTRGSTQLGTDFGKGPIRIRRGSNFRTSSP